MRDRVIDAARFIELRARRGFTIAELAKRSGVSMSLIKYVESRQRQFSDVKAWAVAETLDCHPDDFSYPKPAKEAEAAA